MEDDQSIADLMSMIARHYRSQIADPAIPKNKTRLEVIRKVDLIVQGIRDLMKHEQESL